MSKIVAIASLTAAEGKGNELVEIFRDCIVGSHGEEGCLKYALHRDKSNPDHLVMVEHWRSQEDIDKHGSAPHFQELMQKMAAPGLFGGPPTLWFTESLEIGDPEKGSL